MCIDHFLVAGSILTSNNSICNIFPMLLFRLNDHFPIMFFFTLPITVKDNGTSNRRSLPYDVKRVGDPVCDAVFLKALEAAPPIPLIVEPTSHCRLAEEIIVGAACSAYPFERFRKKKECLSDVTLKILCNRDEALRLFQKREKSLMNFELFAVFMCWAHGHTLKYTAVRGLFPRSVLSNYYRARTQLWYHNRHAAAFVELDRLSMLDDKAVNLEAILHEALDITTIHRHIKSLKHFAKKSSGKVQRVNRSDGSPSVSKFEEKLVFRSHFSSQLGGVDSTFERAHSDSLDSLHDLRSSVSGVGAASVIPGVCALAKLLRSASLGAGGEDRIRGKLCRRFPRALACFYYPLIFKSSCLLPPPPAMARWCSPGSVQK